MSNPISTAAFAVALLVMPVSFASAAGGHAGGHGAAEASHGQPGKAADVTRTIEITLRDNFFEPEDITVTGGETIRFVVTNAGGLVHEFNIGTAASHAEHASAMQMMVDHGVIEGGKINHDTAKAMQASMGHGMHDEPNSALLEPGKTAELIWAFPDRGDIEFACNVPGHYDAGMVIETTIAGTN